MEGNTQNTQNMRNTENMQNTQNAQSIQNAQGTQSAQSTKNARDTQNAQNKINSQTLPNSDKKRRLPEGRRLLVAAVILCIVSLVGMVLALGTRKPAYTPPPFDAAAVDGTPEVPQELRWQELNTSAYTFSLCSVFSPADGAADIWLTNPQGNDVWMKLRVLDEQGNMLGETGLIKPGQYVQSVALTGECQEGDSIKLKLMAYEPETYYSAGAVSLEAIVT